MTETLSQSTPTARKDYPCDACVWLLEFGNLRQIINELDLTFTQKRLIIKVFNDGRKIRKGAKYLKQNNKQGGRIFTFRAIPEIDDVCIKNDIYFE